MAEPTDPTDDEAPTERPLWGRRLALGGGALLLLLLVAYFVVTSTVFLKHVILPRVGKSLNGELTVADASISPFSKIVLRQIKLQTTGAEPLFTAQELQLRWGLFSVLGGNIKIQELTLTAPRLQIVENSDGTRNLEPLLSALTTNQPGAPRSEKPLRLEIKNISLNQGSVRLVKVAKNGTRDTTEISNVDLKLDQLQNAKSGKVSLDALLTLEQSAGPSPTTATNSRLQAKIAGSYSFALDSRLMPETATGTSRLEISQATGLFSELAGLAGTLECDLTPKELRQFTLRFERGGQKLGQAKLSGPLELAKFEGRLVLDISAIDRQVLNLFSAKHGLDFDRSIFNSRSVIDLSQNGKKVSADGKFTGTQVTLKRNNFSTPPLEVELDYQVNFDATERTAVVRSLRLQARQGQTEILGGKLDRPMNLSWGTRTSGFKESAFQAAVTNLNLAEWKALFNDIAPAGTANLQVQVVSQGDGNQIKADLSSQVQELSIRWKTNQFEHARAQFKLSGALENFKRINVDSFRFELASRTRSLITANGTVDYMIDNRNLRFQTSLDVSLPGVLQEYSMPPLTAQAGTLKFSGVVQVKGAAQEASGNLVLADFTGRYGDLDFQSFQTSLDYRVQREGQFLQVQRATLGVRQGYESGGEIDVTGKLDVAKKSGKFTFKSLDLNAAALRPFLAPQLGEKKLVKASVDASGSVAYDPEGESSLKGDFKLANVVVDDPAKVFPKEPLSAQLQIDAGFRQMRLELRQMLLTLTPTTRAKNVLDLKGSLDFAKTNPAPSELSLRADSLDATRYYELFAGGQKTNAATVAVEPRKADSRSAPGEPEPVKSPLQQVALDLNVGRFYLKDLAVTNWQATAKFNQGQLNLNPFKLTLNGAPINGTAALNLGVPGYVYDLAVTADKVPVEPLANTFSSVTKGQYKGDLFLNARVKGAGVTGRSLQKNLSGQLNFNFTNANIQYLSPRARSILTPIAVVLRMPEITDSPLRAIQTQVDLGAGKIDVKHFTVLSDAFRADSRGVIPIAEVLTNSPVNLPVDFSLRRSLAQKSNLMPADASPDAPFVKLPSFVKLTGTLGGLKTEIDKRMIAGLLAKSLAGLPVTFGGKVGNILEEFGGVLTGNGTPAVNTKTNSNSRTNSLTNTNKPPSKFNPLDALKNLLKKQ
ncbi:MAG: AsmA family protein [Verrucomicrobiota bacterium]